MKNKHEQYNDIMAKVFMILILFMAFIFMCTQDYQLASLLLGLDVLYLIIRS